MKHNKPSHWDYTKRTSQEQAIAGKVEREIKLRKLRGDIQALEELQSKRALKPPTRRAP